MLSKLTRAPGGLYARTQETVVLAASLPIKRIVLERRDGKLVVTEVEFDDSLPSPLLVPDLPSPDLEGSRRSPKGHGVGSK